MEEIIKILLFSFLALFLLFSLASVLMTIFIRRKLRTIMTELNTDLKHAVFILILLFNFLPATMVKILQITKRLVVVGNLPWRKNKILIVSNHPSWIDQAMIIQVIFSYLEWLRNPNILPLIGTARDSIEKMPFLKFLENFYFLIPIERYDRRQAILQLEKAAEILRNGHNFLISGPAGRDFRAEEREIIITLIKKKILRRFGAFCGRLAILEGVTTIPAYIEGTEKLFNLIDNGKEARFSPYNFFISYLLLGKFQIKIIFGEPVNLEGWSSEKARKEIEETVLKLADTC